MDYIAAAKNVLMTFFKAETVPFGGKVNVAIFVSSLIYSHFSEPVEPIYILMLGMGSLLVCTVPYYFRIQKRTTRVKKGKTKTEIEERFR